MLNRLITRLKWRFSHYLDTLYQASVEHKTPFFTVSSNQIQIIEDPLDFYLMLSNNIAHSSQKIGLSSLYLGTGPLERHLLAKIKARYQVCPDLQTAMVFDHNRSHRQENGQSPVQILTRFTEQLGGKNVAVSFMKVGKGKGVIGQVLGVHHQKIYLFDDKVIMGGANLSKNYFLNRKDRYICIHSPELSDYLFEYLMILSQQPDVKKLGTHYKLWKYAYMPNKYHQSFKEQLNYLKSIEQDRVAEKSRSVLWQKPQKGLTLSKNQSIANEIGGSLTTVEQLSPQKFIEARQQVRSRLFTVSDQDYVGNELEQLGDPFADLPDLAGQDVHLFPFIQWPILGQNHQYNLFKKILQQASTNGHLIRLSSGYLNIDNQLFSDLAQSSKITPSMQLLCSAPEANSFFGGGGVKNLVPSMYRCFQYNLLNSLGEKALIKEFYNGRWSFHAKGLWLEQAQNSYLTVVGSSNFNARSRTRDTELQLYIYSGCKQLNTRLNKQWKGIEKQCKPVTLNSIKEDKDTKVTWFHRMLSKALSSVL